jgi:hypothetical protein
MPRRRIARRANALIAVALVIAGWAAMRWPDRVGDKDAAATLAGALFGAAALFAGSQVNEWDRREAVEEELEERRQGVRSALAPDFVRVCVNLIGNADILEAYSSMCASKRSREHRAFPPEFDLVGFAPPQGIAFERLTAEALRLPASEIQALVDFYGNIESTRATIGEIANMLAKTGADTDQYCQHIAHILSRYQRHLEDAIAVTRLCWPDLRMESFGGKKGMLVSNELTKCIQRLKRAVDQ